jgi:hypothetical protein
MSWDMHGPIHGHRLTVKDPTASVVRASRPTLWGASTLQGNVQFSNVWFQPKPLL